LWGSRFLLLWCSYYFMFDFILSNCYLWSNLLSSSSNSSDICWVLRWCCCSLSWIRHNFNEELISCIILSILLFDIMIDLLLWTSYLPSIMLALVITLIDQRILLDLHFVLSLFSCDATVVFQLVFLIIVFFALFFCIL